MESFENAGLSFLCGRQKGSFSKKLTSQLIMQAPIASLALLEHAYRTEKTSVLTKKASLDHCFSAPSVDGRKRCENASVDEELFIRFWATKNGGFQKRIIVDRAFVLSFCSLYAILYTVHGH